MKQPNTKKVKTERQLPEAGLQPVVCHQVIDLGTQTPKNPEYKAKRKLMLGFELLNSDITFKRDDEEVTAHHVLSVKCAWNMYGGAEWGLKGQSTALFKYMSGWLGKKPSEEDAEGFDYEGLIGKTCQAQIVHDETPRGTYANIQSLIKDDNVDPSGALEPTVVFSLDDLTSGKSPEDALKAVDTALDTLTPWIADLIKESVEYQTLVDVQGEGSADHPETEDDLPIF